MNYTPFVLLDLLKFRDQFKDIGLQIAVQNSHPGNHPSPILSPHSPTSSLPDLSLSPPKDSSRVESTELEPSEQSFFVPVRQNALFRSWVTSLLVLEKGVLRRYIGKNRNEKKVELINLSDCVASHSTLNSDAKRPYCVIVQPGPSSQSDSSLLLSFASRSEEQEFLTRLKEYR